jgi:hypothetical protein
MINHGRIVRVESPRTASTAVHVVACNPQWLTCVGGLQVHQQIVVLLNAFSDFQ